MLFTLEALSAKHGDSLLLHYGKPAAPKLIVIDKMNGGKADAMNAGINVARAPLVCVIGADTLLESDALIRVVPSAFSI